jgi:hypothetical protein
MYRALKKGLKIERLGSESAEIKFPATRNEWSDVLDAALQVGGYEQNNDSESILKQAAKSKISHQVKCFTHCECKILQYFVTNRPTPPPLSYIGVSKLSCAGCSSVFKIWNDLHHDTKYLCRGSHGKWYFPWAMPNLNSSDDSKNVTDATYQYIAEQFGSAMLGSGQARRRMSDSFAPSVESGEFFISDGSDGEGMKAEMFAMVNNEVQKPKSKAKARRQHWRQHRRNIFGSRRA